MDVNGLPFWQLAGREDFGLSPDTATARVADGLQFSGGKQHLALARQQEKPKVTEDEIFARRMAVSPSPVTDGLGGFAWWDNNQSRIEASGFLPGSIEIPVGSSGDAPPLEKPSDMALGSDEALYVARDGAVVMHDLRDRWPDAKIEHSGFAAHLLAPAAGSGAWAFDRVSRRLARVTGVPLRFSGIADEEADKFKPVDPNSNPPRMIVQSGVKVSDDFDVVAMASSPGDQLALLAWEAGEEAVILLHRDDGFEVHCRLADLRFPFAIAWQGEGAAAILASDGAGIAQQAYVYDLSTGATADRSRLPSGQIFRLLEPWHGKFANAAAMQAQHLQATGSSDPHAIRSLHPLSGGSYARGGKVLIGPIDSGVAGTVWHRIYADAALSDGGSISLQLHASDQSAAPDIAADEGSAEWALHAIGKRQTADDSTAAAMAAWLPQSSEVGNAPSTLNCPVRPEKSGLFTLLLQNPHSRVRRIAGRYLWITLGMSGNSLSSPELSALRVYSGRQSLRDRYLPDFYHEQLTGTDASDSGPATRNDFLERMLESFEGAFTEIEGRIANAWQMTDPACAPDAALPWIGQWIAEDIDAAEAPARARQRLLAAPHCASLHGTQGGLMAALELATGGRVISGGQIERGGGVPPPGSLAMARFGDTKLRGLLLATAPGGGCTILTGGAITRGDIVVLEGFRLRRTFATILGADLVDEEDPLTLGSAVSGNSFVGDTLILGDRAGRELFSLYRGEIDRVRGNAEAVKQFYARLAWRVLVLVRGVDDKSEIERLNETVDAHIPAHVEAQIFAAKSALIVGAASLVGIDSYLSDDIDFERVRLGQSLIGEGDFVAGSGRLDSRADGPVSAPPNARADGPSEVWHGGSFTLSAINSTAAKGRRINRHIWMWDKEDTHG
ncbi:MAG: hypothetical protein V3V15_01305 [Sphingorhabdus sp.]